MGRHSIMRAAALLAGVAGFTGTASAVLFGLNNITSNNAADVTIGKAQLRLDVIPWSPTQVLFTFSDIGSQPSVIEQVFFEQGSLADLAVMTQTSGVSFAEDKDPANLPGGNSLSPKFETAFSASADSPAPFHGVNNTPGGTETLSLLFNLAGGKTFQDVLTGIENGSFRVGLHVIGYASGGSESFVNHPGPSPVPLPETANLLLAGVPIVWRRRR